MIIEKVIDLLKVDLSLKKDNIHCGSELAGNAFEYLFAITHKMFATEEKQQQEDFIWSKDADQIQLKLSSYYLEHFKLKDLRKGFSTFVNSFEGFKSKYASINFEDKVIEKVSLLLKEKHYKDDLQSLFDCATIAQELVDSLDTKDSKVLDQYQLSLTSKIEKYPYYIIIFCSRNVITLERLVKYSLDDYMKCYESIAIFLN